MNISLDLFKGEFREFCCSKYRYYIDQIDSWFTEAGFDKYEPRASTRLEQLNGYYSKIDWENQNDIQKFLKVIESILLYNSYNVKEEHKQTLREICEKSGLEVDSNGYTIHLTKKLGHQNIKNIIFASNSLKPEIIFSDSLSNDIEITKYKESCLIYDKPIQSHGLLWIELIDWWKEYKKIISWSNSEAAAPLYKRLKESLQNNGVESRFFDTYYKNEQLCRRWGENSPALLPQVYLHYDPYNIKELKRYNNGRRLIRQRMDFLLLLPKSKRIVIEIDGKQHYAEGEYAKPQLYAEMVAEDRKLKLLGYEVYRFGASEIMQENYESIVVDFFQKLFDFYDINLDF